MYCEKGVMSDDLFTLTTKHGTLYRHNGTDILAEDDGLWVSITMVDSRDALLVDEHEWPAFVEMINAIDAARGRHE